MLISTQELTPHISSPTQSNIFYLFLSCLLKLHKEKFQSLQFQISHQGDKYFLGMRMNFVNFFTSEPLSHPSNLVGQLCAHFVHMAGQWDFLEWPSRLRDGKSGCLPGALCHRLFPGRWFIQLAHPASIYIYIYIYTYIYILGS